MIIIHITHSPMAITYCLLPIAYILLPIAYCLLLFCCRVKAMGNGLRPEVWDEFQDGLRVPLIVEFYGATEGLTLPLGPQPFWAAQGNRQGNIIALQGLI